MTSDRIRAALRAEPFRPFVLRTTGGRDLNVAHPELLILSPNGRTLVLFGNDDQMDIVDVLMVESIHVGRNGKTWRRKSA